MEQLTGTALRVEPVSLRGLGTGFRDRYQRSWVAALIRDRLADDRDQDECRYLMRFCWELSMPYNEVTMPELREHVTEGKLRVIGELIRAAYHDRICALTCAAGRCGDALGWRGMTPFTRGIPRGRVMGFGCPTKGLALGVAVESRRLALLKVASVSEWRSGDTR